MTQFSYTLPLPASPDTVEDLFFFPTADDIDAAAAEFPYAQSAVSDYRWQKPMLKRDGYREVRGFKEGIFAQLLVSPGACKFRRRNDAQADRLMRRDAQLRELRKSGYVPTARPFTEAQAVILEGYRGDTELELIFYFPRPLTKGNAILLGEWDDDAFNVIKYWSKKSQNNMKLVVSQLDLAPLLEEGSPAMITYTLPGDWLALTPDAQSAAVIWNRYRTLWTDYFGTKPRCIWKREFQRRGAPHWHEWTVVPEYRACSVCKDAPLHVGHDDADRVDDAQREIGTLWTTAVFGERLDAPYAPCGGRCEDNRPEPDTSDPFALLMAPIVCSGCELVRSFKAGTRVDYSKGASARDPRRLATYFLKESGDVEGKSYQNRAPFEWEGQSVGRFWGVRGIEKAIAVIDLDAPTSYGLWRVMRKLRESQRRADRRKIRVRSQAGFVLVHDGAKVARQLAQHAHTLKQLRAGWFDPMELGGYTGTPAYEPTGLRTSTASTRYAARAARKAEQVFEKKLAIDNSLSRT